MTRDKQLRSISLKSVQLKRDLDQALNVKEFAVLAGVSYSVSRPITSPKEGRQRISPNTLVSNGIRWFRVFHSYSRWVVLDFQYPAQEKSLTRNPTFLRSRSMQNNILEVGDVIRIERFGYWHAGVYVGSQTWSGGPDVVHNKKGDGVVLSRLAEFADGCPVIIDQKAIGNFWQRRTIAQRALSLIGKKYDLINFNCEHVVHYAQSGKPESPQIVAAGIAALVLIGIAILGQRS